MFLTIRPGVSYWVTFALALMAVPFYIRIFIFFHDCGHGSFFRNRKANTILAYVCGRAANSGARKPTGKEGDGNSEP